MLSWLIIEKVLRGSLQMLGVATGAVVGLARITQGSGYVPIWAAIIIGTLASPICYFALSVVTAQIIGLFVTVALTIAATTAIIFAIKAFMNIKVSTKEEADCLDVAEHGESAYPSFTGMDEVSLM